VDKNRTRTRLCCDGITKEHHPAVVIHLQFLFNCILMHGCVPDPFGVGVVVPLIKDSLGDVNSSANYRGITLSVILSKMFEYCIIHMRCFCNQVINSLVSKRN